MHALLVMTSLLAQLDGGVRETTVREKAGESRQLARSADAVTVVDTTQAKKSSSDLGEVMARTAGVTLQRVGGLGGETRFSLNGFFDDQVRFFLDGVPLASAGYPFGLANVPVNLIERVEVYRGVVPVRLGADALGGAVNLVTNERDSTGLSASYQVGSWGTHRLTLSGRARHEPSGVFTAMNVFLDRADNDYFIDVQVPDETGRLSDVRVRRFHDAYAAYGASVEVGVSKTSWTKLMSARFFTTAYDKDLQNNAIMTVPYGEVTYGESQRGVTARYVSDGLPFEVSLVANYAYRTTTIDDQSANLYDWYGNVVRVRPIAGEILQRASSQVLNQHGLFGRALISWSPAVGHVLRASLTPEFADRRADDLLVDVDDPFATHQTLFTMVNGVEYELTAFDERLVNAAFVKNYVSSASAEQWQKGEDLVRSQRDHVTFGAGDALRFRVNESMWLKASYEYATRLPRADELFGNGVLITSNVDLIPERSHNTNLGARFEFRRQPWGTLTADVNAFWRESQNLIVLLGADRFLAWRNVFGARTLGGEGGASWTSPGRWVTVDGSFTMQDQRNISDEGTFGRFAGDRVPSRPWLFGSWGVRGRFAALLHANDELEPYYQGRYVHSFFRSWESAGITEFKEVVPAQLTHTVGVTYGVRLPEVRMSASFEVQNLTDARVYDVFGVQRAGRSFYLKLNVDL